MKKIRTLLIMCSSLFLFSCYSVSAGHLDALWPTFEDFPKDDEEWKVRLVPFVDILKKLNEQAQQKEAIVEIVTNVWRKKWGVDFIENLTKQIDIIIFSEASDLEAKQGAGKLRIFWAVLGRISDRFFERPIMCERESGGLRSPLGLRKIQDGVKVSLRKRQPKDSVKASVRSRSTRFGVKESEELYRLVKMDLDERCILELWLKKWGCITIQGPPFPPSISKRHDLIARNMFGVPSKK